MANYIEEIYQEASAYFISREELNAAALRITSIGVTSEMWANSLNNAFLMLIEKLNEN